jgi:hypothetical protein
VRIKMDLTAKGLIRVRIKIDHREDHVKRFSLVPSSAFLCTLASAPAILENGLKISQQDGILFRTLKEGCADIVKAVTLLAGRPKKASAQPLDEEEELDSED